MSLARLVVTAVRAEGRSISAVAGDHRVCRRWVHELLKRFDAEGEAGLAPRSPAGVRLLQELRRQLLHPPRLEAVSTRPSRLPRNLPSSGVRVRPLFHDQWDVTSICTTSSNYCGNKYDYGLEIPMFQ
jgi:hypothetical protein